jgi:hypothetical protein
VTGACFVSFVVNPDPDDCRTNLRRHSREGGNPGSYRAKDEATNHEGREERQEPQGEENCMTGIDPSM